MHFIHVHSIDYTTCLIHITCSFYTRVTFVSWFVHVMFHEVPALHRVLFELCAVFRPSVRSKTTCVHVSRRLWLPPSLFVRPALLYFRSCFHSPWVPLLCWFIVPLAVECHLAFVRRLKAAAAAETLAEMGRPTCPY